MKNAISDEPQRGQPISRHHLGEEAGGGCSCRAVWIGGDRIAAQRADEGVANGAQQIDG